MTFDLAIILPFVGVALGVVATVVVAAVREKNSKVPTIGDIWKRMDNFETELNKERRARRSLQSVFMSYVARVQGGGSHDLTMHERVALELEEPINEGATDHV